MDTETDTPIVERPQSIVVIPCEKINAMKVECLADMLGYAGPSAATSQTLLALHQTTRSKYVAGLPAVGTVTPGPFGKLPTDRVVGELGFDNFGFTTDSDPISPFANALERGNRVTDVALYCGNESISAFIAAVAKLFNATPGDYF